MDFKQTNFRNLEEKLDIPSTRPQIGVKRIFKDSFSIQLRVLGCFEI